MTDCVDFIVVGAGSAGCVVANRLSEKRSNEVVLLEAGGNDRHPRMPMPLACGTMFFDPAVNWGYLTEPEPAADNRVLPRAAGKVLGGGSSINGMMYTRGHPRDYDNWAAYGCAGWSYKEVLPYFQRAENHWRGDDGVHGGDGPLTVSRHMPDALNHTITETARALGYRVCEDFDREMPDGFGLADFTTHRGRRGSTAQRYLKPARGRTNLRVEPGATATRILFDGKRAIGVEYLQGGERKTLYARREVLLSAGAYGSPVLLMLSGIGPADELHSHGIAVLHDLPGVGCNMQEHPGVPVTYASRHRLELERNLRLDRLVMNVVRWRLTGKGPVSRLPFAGIGFVRTREDLTLPDVELLFTPGALDSRIWFPGWRAPAMSIFGAAAFLARPKSRGWVRLRSADPLDAPRIQLGALADPGDLQTLIASVRMIRRFMATSPASALIDHEVAPGSAAETDEAIAAHIRQTVRTMQHPTSTCMMGVGVDAVVDPELKVCGVAGLRVIDASIMPEIVVGHTNGPTIMIGEKGAALVLEDARKSIDEKIFPRRTLSVSV